MHCVAGLGRAPVLVAIALIEAGMPAVDTVEFVRKKRRGALNTVQLGYLMDSYKRQWKKPKNQKGSAIQRESSNSGSSLFSKVFKFNKS